MLKSSLLVIFLLSAITPQKTFAEVDDSCNISGDDEFNIADILTLIQGVIGNSNVTCAMRCNAQYVCEANDESGGRQQRSPC